MARKSEYPLIDMFPYKIKNVRAFYNRDHPVNLHPNTDAYKSYWKPQIKKCILGNWVDDNGTWVYMFPVLYWYINIVKIANEGKKTKERGGIISPDLRDNEWIYFTYDFITDGFSGFEDDKEITCNFIVGMIQNGEEVEDVLMRELTDNCYIDKKKDILKKYIDPWEYLTRYYLIDNPAKTPLGNPLYENLPQNGLCFTSRGLGKDNKWDTIVYKENGQCIINDIKIGDRIYGADGKLTTVIDRADYYNQMQYKVTFDDGRVTYCGDGHLWEIYKMGGSRDQSYVWPLKEIRKNYLGYEGKAGNIKRTTGKRDSKYYVKMCEPVQYPEKELHIDPYFLGLWLGDGFSNGSGICSEDKEIKDYAKKYFIELGLGIRIVQKLKDTNPDFEHIYSIINPNEKTNKLKELLRHYNLINNKHIPSDYLYASVEQRMELVRGIMDTDGHISSSGHIELVQKNKELIDSFCLLLSSLGIKYHRKEKLLRYHYGKILPEPWVYHRIKINTDKDIFKLKRKKERLKPSVLPSVLRQRNFNAIRNIEPYKVEHSVCLGVDNSTSLFLCDEYIVTHNSLMAFAGKAYHMFTFNGVKTWEEYRNVEDYSCNIFTGSPDDRKMSQALKMIRKTRQMLPGTYSYMDENGKRKKIQSPFYVSTKGSWAVGEEVSKLWKGVGGNTADDEGSGTAIAFKSMVKHDVATAGRYKYVLVEEIGLLKFARKFYRSVEDSMIVGTKSGKMWGIGTGGDIEAVQDSKYMWQNIKNFDIYGIPNYWNPNSKIRKIPLFIPIIYKDDRFKDENGNTNLLESYKDKIKLERDKYEGGTEEYKAFLMNNPFIPDHIFYSSTHSILPSEEAAERIAYLETGIWERKARIGWLKYDAKAPNGVSFYEDSNLKPIITYINVDPKKMTPDEQRGAVIMYEPPPTYPIEDKNLYKIIIDQVYSPDGGPSFNALWVYKGIDAKGGMQDTIVMEWTGRIIDETMDKTFELFLSAALLYGCKMFVEDNIKEFSKWIVHTKGLGHLLQGEAYLVEKEIFPNYKRRRGTGYIMRGRKDQLVGLTDRWQKEWLLAEKYPMDIENSIDAIRTIDTMYSLRYLYEVANYSDDGNFDNISAARGLMLWLKQEQMQYGGKNAGKEEEIEQDSGIEKPRNYQVHVNNVSFLDD